MTDSNGIARLSGTNSFGYYQFEGIPASGDYNATASSKRYAFSSRVLQVTGNLANVDFTALP
jgi:hypothetical protein